MREAKHIGYLLVSYVKFKYIFIKILLNKKKSQRSKNTNFIGEIRFS